MKILVVDIGGTNVKMQITGQTETMKFASGAELTPQQMMEGIRTATAGMDYDVVSLGFPGPVVNNRPLKEPVNLGTGWFEFDFEKAFGRPVKLINDAALQALGSYEGGRMLFLGLGTGMGSTLIIDKVVAPMELGHLPYKKGLSFEDYVGRAGMERRGKQKWMATVAEVVAMLKDAMVADYVVLGGGNSRKLEQIPEWARLGDNRHAFLGGYRLWEGY